MKIQPYVQKLEASEIYKKFRKDNSESFLVAGFFILDYESGVNMHQIDYYVPSKKQVAAFNLDGEVEVRLLDMMSKEKVPEKLDLKTKVDLDAIKGILEDEMKNRNITESIKKCVAVIQVVDGKKLWVLNCVLSGMEILKAHVDDNSRTVLKMERNSMLDYIKKIPGAGMQNQQGQQNQQKASKEQLQKQIEQLDKLKEQLQKEQNKVNSEDKK
ncbi:hypothetical protein J4423_00065 [Candidatus Pacearchaeota archaeon]|nr:hypothetical protein [Candidatus Pacearchaeota archaeon]